MKKETNNTDLYSVLDVGKVSTKTKFEHAIVRPLKMLLTQPPVFIISLYIAVVYGILYLMFSTFTFVFAQQYGFGTGIIGLSYLPTGAGMLLGTMVFGVLTDIIIKKKMAKGETTVPEDRVPVWLTLPCGLLIVVSLFWYGWSVESHTHWMVPMIGVALFCFGLMGIMVSNTPISMRRQKLTVLEDVPSNLSHGRLHHIRCLRNCRCYCPPIPFGCHAAACWIVNVQQSRIGLGKQRAGIPFTRFGTGACRFPILWP